MRDRTFITISEAQRAELNDLRRRTGVGPYALLKGQRRRMPEGLSGQAIAGWLNGARKTARRAHLDFVIALWEDQALSSVRRVPLTKAHLQEIKEHRARTGVAPKALFKPPFTPPADLSVQMVQNWLQGAIKTVREDHLDYVLSSWRALPDIWAPPPQRLGVETYEIEHGRIVLGAGILNRLRALRDQSGCAGTALLKEARKMGRAIPAGLTVAEIARWLSGQAKTADPAQLLFVVDMLEDLAAKRSDAEKTRNATVSTRPQKPRRVSITNEIRGRLEAARARSGLSQAGLIKRAPDAPDGLSANTISAWINGYTKSARKDWLDWVVRRWEQMASNPKP